jgi:hypothetical protein
LLTERDQRAGQSFDEALGRDDDTHGYEAPRLVVMGSMEELTRGASAGDTDTGSISEA